MANDQFNEKEQGRVFHSKNGKSTLDLQLNEKTLLGRRVDSGLAKQEYKKRLEELKKLQEEEEKAIEKQAALRKKLSEGNASEADKAELKTINASFKERKRQIALLQDETQKAADAFGAKLTKSISAALQAVASVKTELNSIMTAFLTTQESMAYNLRGSGSGLHDVLENLNSALNGTGIVKTKEVYEELSKLVKEGIVFNVEQRAYMAQLTEDLGMQYKADSANLNRLINLQREDLSSQRIAIEASLKEFLNQNYQTSQYIKNGFEGVADALIEAQSLMTSTSAMSLEAVIQKWLGSLSSSGASSSTITSLATALGQLGSGNLNALSGSAMQNLLIMGASKANLSYADLLTYGLNAQTANQLMSGIIGYMSYMGDNQSNVVKSAYGDIFGVSVSDIVAAQKINETYSNEGKITTDIYSSLLNKVDDYIYFNQKFDNFLDNFMYAYATDIASNKGLYTAYKITDMITSSLASTLNGTIIRGSPLGVGIDLNVSEILQAAPMLLTIRSLGESVIEAVSNMGKNIGGNGAANIYNSLQNSGGLKYIKSAGDMLGNVTTGVTTSGATYIATTDQSDIVAGANTSAKNNYSETLDQEASSTKSMDDIYTMLDTINTGIGNLATTQFVTTANISQAENTVTIGNDLTYIQDMITMSAMNLQNIYLLLVGWSSGNNSVMNSGKFVDTTSYEFSNNLTNNLDWVASATSVITGA